MSDFPSISFSPVELQAEVNRLIGLAKEQRPDVGAVNWGDLKVCDIEYRASVLWATQTPGWVVLVDEASPESLLASWLYERMDKEKFPRVYIECEW